MTHLNFPDMELHVGSKVSSFRLSRDVSYFIQEIHQSAQGLEFCNRYHQTVANIQKIGYMYVDTHDTVHENASFLYFPEGSGYY